MRPISFTCLATRRSVGTHSFTRQITVDASTAYLRTDDYASQIGAEAPAYLAMVLKCASVTTRTCPQAPRRSSNDQRRRGGSTPSLICASASEKGRKISDAPQHAQHPQLVIRDDEDHKKSLNSNVISEGGVLRHAACFGLSIESSVGVDR